MSSGEYKCRECGGSAIRHIQDVTSTSKVVGVNDAGKVYVDACLVGYYDTRNGRFHCDGCNAEWCDSNEELFFM